MSGQLVIGDDLSIPVQLKKSGLSFTIPGTATVEAAIVDTDRSALLSDIVTCIEGATGADWTTSLVIVDFTEIQSAAIPRGEAYLEIQVDDNGKNTWFVSVEAIQGNIP